MKLTHALVVKLVDTKDLKDRGLGTSNNPKKKASIVSQLCLQTVHKPPTNRLETVAFFHIPLGSVVKFQTLKFFPDIQRYV